MKSLSHSHRDLCIQVARYLLAQQANKLVFWELRVGRSVFDVIALNPKTKRFVVCEVKRTRADLLADLRAGKMLKYAAKASHCYLALTPEALGKDSLEDLKTKGLPTSWGVLLVRPGGIESLRGARALNPVDARTIAALVYKIAVSYCWRTLDGRLEAVTNNDDQTLG